MQNDGKIWVVITVIVIIQLAIFGYMWMIDRKISRLEKKNNELDENNSKE